MSVVAYPSLSNNFPPFHLSMCLQKRAPMLWKNYQCVKRRPIYCLHAHLPFPVIFFLLLLLISTSNVWNLCVYGVVKNYFGSLSGWMGRSSSAVVCDIFFFIDILSEKGYQNCVVFAVFIYHYSFFLFY